ncbi:MAG: hypothetical protein ABIO58_00485 [Luteimonas sp.]
MVNSDSAPTGQRSRKLAWIAGAVALVLLLLALSLRFALQPERVTGLILDRVGSALGLEITASSTGEYRLRGTPTLVVRNVVAREPGAATPLLRADRIFLSLPWSTIRARGSDLTVNRIEIERPLLDLDALQHWLDRRPPGKTRIPTLTDGLRVRDGTIVTAGWTLTEVALELPTLHPGQRVNARTSGRYRSGSVQAPFALDVVLSQPAADAALGIAGQIGIERERWRIPARVVLSGMLHLGNGWRLDRARLAAVARYVSGDTDLPFVLGMAGTLRHVDGRLGLVPAGIAVRGDSPIPDIDAHGAVALADALELQLTGSLQAWPEAWPTLPPPIGESQSPLPFALQYTGNSDFSDIAALQLRRDAARFDGRFRLPDVTAWIDAAAGGSPLPPLDGRVTTPGLEISGAQLEGVEITLDEPDVPDVDGTP